MERENHRIAQTTTEARAGVTGHHVRIVLVASTVALCLLFVGVYLYFFA